MSKPRQRIRANHNKAVAKPKSFTTYLRKGLRFVAHSPKSETYREAVITGQTLAGYGNFYVDSGEWVPPRETQLLETKEFVRQSKLNKILDTI